MTTPDGYRPRAHQKSKSVDQRIHVDHTYFHGYWVIALVEHFSRHGLSFLFVNVMRFKETDKPPHSCPPDLHGLMCTEDKHQKP